MSFFGLFGKKEEKEYVECCALCEMAKICEDGNLFCRKKKANVKDEDGCRHFSYDIMKRKAKPKSEKFTLGD